MAQQSQVSALLACREDCPEWLREFPTSSPSLLGFIIVPDAHWQVLITPCKANKYDGFQARVNQNSDEVRCHFLAVHHLRSALEEGNGRNEFLAGVYGGDHALCQT